VSGAGRDVPRTRAAWTAHIRVEGIAGTCQERKLPGRNTHPSRASLAEYLLVLGLFGLIRPWPENDSKRGKTVQVWDERIIVESIFFSQKSNQEQIKPPPPTTTTR